MTLEADNRRLRREVGESHSQDEALQYKKRLFESDLSRMRREEKDRLAEISSLSLQVKALQEQLVSLCRCVI